VQVIPTFKAAARFEILEVLPMFRVLHCGYCILI